MRHGTPAVLSLAAWSALVASSGAWSSTALADPSSADTAAARSLGIEGFKLAAAGQCADAIDKLTRSDALHHAVTILEKLGECQLKVGKIVDGMESLRKVTHEQLPP